MGKLIYLRPSNIKSMKLVYGILLFGFFFSACQEKPTQVAQTKNIIVYGSNNCDHCVNFKAQLDSIGFQYNFKDVEFNVMQANEMVMKVQQAGLAGGISYPVIDVEGTILIAPELQKVLELMK